MELVNNKYNCTGCGCCEKLCPNSAIKMKEDEKGFLYPEIINKYCTNCGICKKNCPNIEEKIDNREIEIYAMKNKDNQIRETSSSGGIFWEYASIILKNNGVVFGAAYNELHEVEHIKVENIEELYKLQGSKYVQSIIKNTYNEAGEFLKKGREVLFSGTPCQIEGLKNFLNKKKIDNSKLYTCDIICHGVPSPKVFKDYLKDLEQKYNSKIKKINFRYKEDNYTQNIKIDFCDGERYISNYFKDDYFYKLFLNDFILREACFECKYTSFNRVADITIGDFWGIEKSIKNFDDKKGVSLVLINTSKGKEIYEKIKDKFEIEKTCKENCIQDNLVKPRDKIKEYDKIWEEYSKYGYKVLKELIKKEEL